MRHLLGACPQADSTIADLEGLRRRNEQDEAAEEAAAKAAAAAHAQARKLRCAAVDVVCRVVLGQTWG